MKNLRLPLLFLLCAAAIACLVLPGPLPQTPKNEPLGNGNPPTVQGIENTQPNEAPAKEEGNVNGPTSFWVGSIIIGEKENQGKVELVAGPGKKAAILASDKENQNIYRFDSIPGMEQGEMYIRLQNNEKPPLISSKYFQEGKELEMHHVYQLSQAVKDGRITPLVAPHLMSPGEPMYRQEGQQIEGRTWSILSFKKQMYGK